MKIKDHSLPILELLSKPKNFLLYRLSPWGKEVCTESLKAAHTPTPPPPPSSQKMSHSCLEVWAEEGRHPETLALVNRVQDFVSFHKHHSHRFTLLFGEE